jgi:DNA-binding transcriptional regulator YdaS (Cro superfamily)
MERKVNLAIAYAGLNQSKVAKLMGVSPANFNSKIKRETLKLSDLHDVATAIGAQYICKFVFDDGEEI